MNKFYLAVMSVVVSSSIYATQTLNSSSTVAKIASKSEVIIQDTNCAPDSPCDIVSKTSTKILEIVNKGVAQSETVELINNIVAPQFDFLLMTKYVLGKNWKLANQDQQKQLVALFKDLLIYTYSTALSKFKGAQITIKSSNITEKKAAVFSEVRLPNSSGNSQPIKVEYDMAKLGSAIPWKAYDIKIETASLVTAYRNQFNDIVQTSKIDGLITQLQTKITSLKSSRKK